MTDTVMKTSSTSVVALADRMRTAPMQVPYSSAPTPRQRPSEPPEVRELGAVWVGTDRLLNGLQQQVETVMGAMLTAMSPDAAREAIMQAVRLGITETLKQEIKGGCGND